MITYTPSVRYYTIVITHRFPPGAYNLNQESKGGVSKYAQENKLGINLVYKRESWHILLIYKMVSYSLPID